MKIKTTDLTGKALDWAVGVAVGANVVTQQDGPVYDADTGYAFEPTANWGQLGPIIEKYNIELIHYGCYGDEDEYSHGDYEGNRWESQLSFDGCYIDQYIGEAIGGKTPQIAACRAIVESKLGVEVDVPEVLV